VQTERKRTKEKRESQEKERERKGKREKGNIENTEEEILMPSTHAVFLFRSQSSFFKA